LIDDNLSVSPGELRALLERQDWKDPVVVDVREPDEFADWRITPSVNLPLTDRKFVGNVEKILGGRQIVAVCTRGNRSLYAVELLREDGLQAWSLEGGLVAWSKVHLCARVEIPRLGDTKILQIRRLLRGCTSYIVGSANECAVFDPSSNTEQYTSIAARYGLRITHVIDTHQHADHISGARSLATTTGAMLHLSTLDGYKFDGFAPIRNGERISLSNGAVTIEVLHTPGHTVGSMCFLIENDALLSGDTLMLEGVGRPDLHRSEEQRARELYHSCKKMLSRLDRETIVLPGHLGLAANTTVESPICRTLTEIGHEVGLTDISESEFVETLLKHEMPPPSNYHTILRINSGESRLDPALIDLLEEGHNRCISPMRPT